MTPDELHAMLSRDDEHWWYRGRRLVLRAELERLPLEPGPRLLDAGCGSGRTLDELARYGRVSGVDLSPDAVETARRRGHDDVQVARVEELPFADGTFDVVTCLDVVEHTPDDRATLAELRRVTRPGGLLLVTVPA
jgi:2-polyprenyl-3-methyl-5-hydroxy-6-metoxy-1,4-benzoquinol methylase